MYFKGKIIMKVKKLFTLTFWLKAIRYLRNYNKFQNQPKKLVIGKDSVFLHPKHIHWGENCSIGQRAAICPLHNHFGKKYPSNIHIGNNVSIGAYDRIASAYSVTIEDDVLMAAFVHITDHSHGYEDITKPISQQDIIHKGPVVIGKGSWLAFGCHILSGVTIGEHCVVAANSVVTKSIPPFSVVAGNPAKIIKQYNQESQKWEIIKNNK